MDLIGGTKFSSTFKGLFTGISSSTKSWFTPNVTLAPCKGSLVFWSFNLPFIVNSCRVGIWLFNFSLSKAISALTFWFTSISVIFASSNLSCNLSLADSLRCLFLSLLCSRVKLDPNAELISSIDVFVTVDRSMLYWEDKSWILLDISTILTDSPNKDLPLSVSKNFLANSISASPPIKLLLLF